MVKHNYATDLMSKKKLHLYKKYYSRNYPGKILDNVDSNPVSTKGSFREVLKYLVDQKYIFLTEDGFCHLLPKGVFIQEVISKKAQEMLEAEGMLHYRFSTIFPETKDIYKNLTSKFKKQLFEIVAENKKIGYLKYASDPLLFSYFSNRKVYTTSGIYSPDFCFRYFRTGEMKPLIQPKEFFITDFHCFCEPKQFETYVKFALVNKGAVELFVKPEDWHLNIDVNIEFFDKNKISIIDMLDKISVNAVINVTSKKTHYYSIQNQYIVEYFLGNETQLANLQFDEENGKAFRIESYQSGYPVNVIHGSLFGRSEKILALVFGKQIEESKKNLTRPILPLWLSPIIIRIIPIKENISISTYIKQFEQKLIALRSRYEIDTRELSLSRKILDAEKDWIPFQIMIGEKELKNSTLSIRDRSLGNVYPLSLDNFISKLANLDVGNISTQNTPSIFRGNDFY